MSSALQKISRLENHDQFLNNLNKVDEQSNKEDEALKKEWLDAYSFQIDKVRKRNGFYVRLSEKKELEFPEEYIRNYLEVSMQLKKNELSRLNTKNKKCMARIKVMDQSLDQVVKEYRHFTEKKNKQVSVLQATIKDLQSKLADLESKYKLLGEEKVSSWGQSDSDAKLSGLGKMDEIFQKKLEDLNFGQAELLSFKKLKNNIIGKFEQTISLLQRKEAEKDKMDQEADLEMEYHRNALEVYRKEAEEAKKKEKDSTEIANLAKEQLSKFVDFVYREKSRYEGFNIQLAQQKRRYKKLQDEKKKLRKEIDDLEKKMKKTLGQKVDAMMAAKTAKEQKEAAEIRANQAQKELEEWKSGIGRLKIEAEKEGNKAIQSK